MCADFQNVLFTPNHAHTHTNTGRTIIIKASSKIHQRLYVLEFEFIIIIITIINNGKKSIGKSWMKFTSAAAAATAAAIIKKILF